MCSQSRNDVTPITVSLSEESLLFTRASYEQDVATEGHEVPFRGASQRAYNRARNFDAVSVRSANHRELRYLPLQGSAAVLQSGRARAATPFRDHRAGHLSERSHAVCGRATLARGIHPLRGPRQALDIFR